MKKTPLLFLLLCLVFGNLQAQKESQLDKTLTLGLNLIGADLIYEVPVSERATFRVLAGGVFSGQLVETQRDDFEFRPGVLLNASATYRFYYKMKDINRKNKPLLYNSGNYIFSELKGTQGFYESEPGDPIDVDDNTNVTFGVGWGIQRMYQNKFVFSLGIGPGYEFTEGDFTLIGELTLGIRLNPKK